MRPIKKTVYHCQECGRMYEGTGVDLPCGHKRYRHYGPLDLRNIVLIGRQVIRVVRTLACPDSPLCRAVREKVKRFLRATSVPN